MKINNIGINKDMLNCKQKKQKLSSFRMVKMLL